MSATATLGLPVESSGPFRPVELDISRLVETRLLVQANSGGGKSWALRRLLEQTHGEVQHIVIDPEGEFATLREKFDYVLAGQDGDCAAEPRSAHLLARKLLELGVSAICDIYELKQHQRIEFVNRFLTALVNAPKRLWHPVLIVLDEAHVFCPERGKAESGAAVIDLATRGRKRGMCAVLATQRLSKLRKDAAAELNNVIIGRTGLDVDITRAADTLGLTTRDDRQALRFLKPGQFYGFGPALPDGVTLIRVGDVQTTHPTLQQGRIASVAPPPTPKITAMLSELTDLPETAAREAKDLDAMRRENASLRGKLRAAQRSTGQTDSGALRDARNTIKGLRQDLQAAQSTLKLAMDSDREAISRVRQWESYSEGLGGRLAEVLTTERPGMLPGPARRPADSVVTRSNGRPRGKTTVERETSRREQADGQPDDITRPRQAILDALMLLEAMGVAPALRTHVAAFAGASPRSSAYTNNLGRLRSYGLLDYPGSGLVELTDSGRGQAEPVTTPPTPDDLRGRWLDMVSAPQARILQALFKAWPGAVTRITLAEQAGASAKSSAYTNNLGRLRSLGLIEYVNMADGGDRGVRVSDDLFEVNEGVLNG